MEFLILIFGKRSKYGTSVYSINDVDVMEGSEFENFIALLFSKMGYSAKTTKSSGDQGIDVIAERNNLIIGIQAKCYGGSVGNTAVQEAVAGKKYYNCNKIIVVTNNYFTASAIDLARVNNVILWDREILKDKIKDYLGNKFEKGMRLIDGCFIFWNTNKKQQIDIFVELGAALCI